MAMQIPVWVALTILGTSGLGTLALMFVMLCGNPESRGVVGRLNRAVLGVADYFQGPGFFSAVERVVGAACCDRMLRTYDYVLFQKNPIFPSMYFCFVGGGFFIFMRFAWPFLDFHAHEPWGVAAYHKFNAFFIISGCIAVFVANLRSDPGVITADNAAEEEQRFPYDDVIYKRKDCSTCGFNRPARSKHCSTCDVCVARFDHHCPWINNCVGAGNLRLFLAFLAIHVFLCTYGAILLFCILRAIVSEKGLFEMFVRTGAGGALEPVSLSVVVRWCLHLHAPLVGLCVALGMIALVLAGFLSYHLFLVAVNTTTNETFKWKDLRRDIRARDRNQQRRAARAEAGESEPEKECPEARRLRAILWELSDLRNAYNNGVLTNLGEALFPGRFLARALRRAAARGGAAQQRAGGKAKGSKGQGGDAPKSRRSKKSD